MKPQNSISREIGLVVLVFRSIGWALLVLYFPMTLVCGIRSGILIFDGEVQSSLVLGVATAVNGGFVAMAAAFLRTAEGVRKTHLGYYRSAMFLSAILLLGFSLLTPLGAVCLFRLRSRFSGYCNEQKRIGNWES